MKRALLLGLLMALVFSGVAGILVQLMPQPLRESDYVVIGSVATLGALLVLFFLMAASKPGLFLRKRKKP